MLILFQMLALIMWTTPVSAGAPVRSRINFVPDIEARYSITYSDIYFEPSKLKQLTTSPFELKKHRSPIKHSTLDLEFMSAGPARPTPDGRNRNVFSWLVLLAVVASLAAILFMRHKIQANRFVSVQNGD